MHNYNRQLLQFLGFCRFLCFQGGHILATILIIFQKINWPNLLQFKQ